MSNSTALVARHTAPVAVAACLQANLPPLADNLSLRELIEALAETERAVVDHDRSDCDCGTNPFMPRASEINRRIAAGIAVGAKGTAVWEAVAYLVWINEHGPTCVPNFWDDFEAFDPGPFFERLPERAAA